MKRHRLYVEHADLDAEFWGAGPPPSLLEEALCRCGAVMRVVVQSVAIGEPPIYRWDWVCRRCARTLFGGRWRDE